MPRFFTALALTTALVAPGIAAAQDFSISAGVTATSRYMSSGIPQTDGGALQPYVEFEASGFYAGIWASNLSRTITGHRSEVDLYFGYRGEAGPVSFDIGYVRYLYRSPSWNCCGEIILDLGVSVTDQFGLGVNIAHDPDSGGATNSSVYASFAPMDRWSFDVSAGKINRGGHSYYTVGTSYALTDAFSADLTWHKASIRKGVLVASLSYDFSLR